MNAYRHMQRHKCLCRASQAGLLGSSHSETDAKCCATGQVAAAPGSRSTAGQRTMCSSELPGYEELIRWTRTAGWFAAQTWWRSRWRLEGEERTPPLSLTFCLFEGCDLFFSLHSFLALCLLILLSFRVALLFRSCPTGSCTKPSGAPGCLFLQELKLTPLVSVHTNKWVCFVCRSFHLSSFLERKELH